MTAGPHCCTYFTAVSLSNAAAAHATCLVRSQLPPILLKFATGATFFIELILLLLIFSPRRLRFCAALGILLLQASILITGNYNWFKSQTMLLCLPLFDDAAIRKILPPRLARLHHRPHAGYHRRHEVDVAIQ